MLGYKSRLILNCRFFFSFSSCNEKSTRRSNGVSAYVASSATGVLRGQMAFIFGCPSSVGGHDLGRDLRRFIHINERDVKVTSEHNWVFTIFHFSFFSMYKTFRQIQANVSIPQTTLTCKMSIVMVAKNIFWTDRSGRFPYFEKTQLTDETFIWKHCHTKPSLLSQDFLKFLNIFWIYITFTFSM